MNERIHRVLDGELDAAQLTAEERGLLAEYRALIDQTSAALPNVAAPDLSGRVQARIEAMSAPASPQPEGASAASIVAPLARAWRWLWSPKTIRLRPAYGLAFATAAALVVLPLAERGVSPMPTAAPSDVAVDQRAPQVYVHFRLDAPDASSVRLAGDFTGWQPTHELHEVAPGVWSAIVPVRAGVHDYAFVVDGEEWRPDPLAMQVDDGFGGTNSRLSILPPVAGRV